MESWADIVLRDPSRADEVENFLSQFELQRAERPAAPTLAAVVELARGAPGVALARTGLARNRMGSRPDPLLTLIEARAYQLLGEEDEAAARLARVEVELRSAQVEISAARAVFVAEWLARWR